MHFTPQFYSDMKNRPEGSILQAGYDMITYLPKVTRMCDVCVARVLRLSIEPAVKHPQLAAGALFPAGQIGIENLRHACHICL